MYREAIEAWRSLGYHASDYGANYEVGDFGDRTHLSATGGRKLAHAVATEIKAIATELGYQAQKGSGR